MSKLKIALSSGFAVAGLTGIFLFCKTAPEIAYANNKELAHTHESQDPSDMWGKSNAPVHVKIQEIQKTGSIVELKGLIRSKISGLQIEWTLPDGAVVVDGELQKSASANSNGTYTGESLKVDVSNAADKPIIFVAYIERNGERVGHSRAYKWNISEQEKEHVEKIRAKMKARKSKFIR